MRHASLQKKLMYCKISTVAYIYACSVSALLYTTYAILSSILTRCNVIQYSLLLSMLYVFQAVSSPIIRSSKTVHTASGMCQAATASGSSKQA